MSSILAIPDYRLWRWEYFEGDRHSEDQKLPWLNLFVGMPQGRFMLSVNRGDFNKSPDRLVDFEATLRFLQGLEIKTSIRLTADETITEVNKNIKWIIPSLLGKIRNRRFAGEVPPRQESLEEFWSRPWSSFTVLAENNELILEGGEPLVASCPPCLEFCTGHQLVVLGKINRGTLSAVGSADITIRARDEAAVVADQPLAGFLMERAANMARFNPGDKSKIDYPIAFRPLYGYSELNIQKIIEKHNYVNQLADCSKAAQSTDDPAAGPAAGPQESLWVGSRVASRSLDPNGARILAPAPLPPPPSEPINVLRTQFIIARSRTITGAVSEAQGILGLATEHPGPGTTTLRDALASGTAPAEWRARWKKDLVRALARLHASGVVWGDVRLESVLVLRDQAWIHRLGPPYHGERLGRVCAEMPHGTYPQAMAARQRIRSAVEAEELRQDDAKELDTLALGTLFGDPLWGL